MPFHRVLGLAVVACFVLAAEALAASSLLTGSVVSEAGTSLPGASVTIVHAATGNRVEFTAGDRGVFRARGLARGIYEVIAKAPGFVSSSATVELENDHEATVRMVLRPTLREIVKVTAPSPRDSVEATNIRRSAARDVGEVLASTPGVWSLRKGGIANEVVLRGFQSRDVGFLIDGERVFGACPNHMDPPAFHVDFAEVERIEVAKGPFDVQNQGSLAGTIRVVTRRPEPGWHGTPNLAAGSWGYANPSATVSYGGGSASFLGGYSYRSSDPYRDGSGHRFTENVPSTGYAPNYRTDAQTDPAYRVGTAWARGRFAPGEGQTLGVAYTRQDAYHVDYPYLQMDAIDDHTDRAHVDYERTVGLGPFERLAGSAYFTRVGHFMTDAYRTTSLVPAATRGYSMGAWADTRTAGGRVEARASGVTFGVEAFDRFWDVTHAMAAMGYKIQHSLPSVGVRFTGVFAESEVPLSPRLTLVSGLRMDRAASAADAAIAPTDLYFAYHGTRATSRTDTLPSGNVRVSFRGDGGIEATAGIGRTVRVPEASERYFGLRRSTQSWVGDPGLDPSRNTEIDLSVSLRRRGFYLGATAFGSRVTDFITIYDQVLVNAAPMLSTHARSYANVDAAFWGGEIDTVVPVTDRVFISAQLSSTRGRQDPRPELGILSGFVPEMPPLRFRTSARYNARRFWLDGEWVLAQAQRRVNTDLNESPTPGYGTVCVRGGFDRGPLAFTGGVSNLFNRTYADYLSSQRDPFRSGLKVNEPGRTVFVNLGWRL